MQLPMALALALAAIGALSAPMGELPRPSLPHGTSAEAPASPNSPSTSQAHQQLVQQPHDGSLHHASDSISIAVEKPAAGKPFPESTPGYGYGHRFLNGASTLAGHARTLKGKVVHGFKVAVDAVDVGNKYHYKDGRYVEGGSLYGPRYLPHEGPQQQAQQQVQQSHAGSSSGTPH